MNYGYYNEELDIILDKDDDIAELDIFQVHHFYLKLILILHYNIHNS